MTSHQPPTAHSTGQLSSHHRSYLGTLFCATNNTEAKPCLLSNQSDQSLYPFYTRSCGVNTHSWSETQPSQIPRISTNNKHEIFVSTLQTITEACQLVLLMPMHMTSSSPCVSTCLCKYLQFRSKGLYISGSQICNALNMFFHKTQYRQGQRTWWFLHKTITGINTKFITNLRTFRYPYLNLKLYPGYY
jgi:hypothetical protein